MAPEEKPAGRRYRDLALPLRVLVGITFATIVGLTIAQVVLRFVFDTPLIWSEELVRLLLVWLVFIGSAVVVWDGRHLTVDVLFSRLPPRGQRFVRNLNEAIAVVFLALLVWYSIPVVELESMSDLAALGISAAWVRVPATIGGILMIAFLLLRRFYRLPRERALLAADSSADTL